MSKLLRSLVLFAAIAGLMSSVSLPNAPGQDKTKKDTKAKPAVEEIGVCEVWMAKDGWRFRIKNAEGKSVAIGTVGHDKKEDALKVIEFVKTTLNKTKVVEVKDEKK